MWLGEARNTNKSGIACNFKPGIPFKDKQMLANITSKDKFTKSLKRLR